MVAVACGQTTPTLAGGRVVLALTSDANGLNPLLVTDPQSTTASRRIYDSLVGYDPKTGEAVARLAESWSVTPDNASITYTLRDNLSWSDGSPLTVDDLRFTLEALLRSKKAPAKATVASEIVGGQDFVDGKTPDIAGISTSGRSLSVQLTQPLCTAVGTIGLLPILPRRVFGKYLDPADPTRSLDDAPENNAPPLASGPFRFQEWVPNDHLTLLRNDRFYLGPARFDEWVYRVIPNPTAIASALKTGEVDVAQLLGQVTDLKATSSLEVHSVPGSGYTYIAWNELRGGKEFFADKTVRQALAYGLNWNEIIATLAGGEAVRVVAHTPPPSWAYDPTGLNDYAYDPGKARQLLEGDGWTTGPDGIYQKNGQRLAFTLITNPESPLRVALVQVAVQQYRQIGVDVTPQIEAFQAFLPRTISSRDPTYGDQGGRDFDAYLISWGQIGPDPDAYAYWHSSQLLTGLNRVGYRNPATDRAIEAGRASCALADRRAAYHQMDLLLNEDQPVNFGFVTTEQLVVSKHIQGVEPAPYSFLAQWNVEQWYRVP